MGRSGLMATASGALEMQSQQKQQCFCCFDRKTSIRPKKRTSLVCAAAKGPIGDVWKEVVDPASGKVYYWNTATNQTSWSPPDGGEASNKTDVSSSSPTSSVLSDAALLEKLITADVTRFGAECEPHRTRLFEDEDFGNYLNTLIQDTEDSGYREKLEKLRARLANPLLKNPQPFDDNTLEVNF
ncbi:hypothetical protein KFL_002740080 [Klebsormidium nitens]|uniref:WW domain-containing protein n=1 Tax=Klebsormidium nitens TaxID=105231 RepID=A0A1Y1I9R4_KLENI|nr:hypothetical protein KFL_002740080 [Klebsormidium nitens]|eukprot:GAQ86169.1 hypothetical protein KFL_002740080 [Klebsormidium nitens]